MRVTEEALAQLREEITPLLPEGLRIHDIVYRQFGMGVFGGEGISAVFAGGDSFRCGVRFEEYPNADQITSSIAHVVNRFHMRTNKTVIRIKVYYNDMPQWVRNNETFHA